MQEVFFSKLNVWIPLVGFSLYLLLFLILIVLPKGPFSLLVRCSGWKWWRLKCWWWAYFLHVRWRWWRWWWWWRCWTWCYVFGLPLISCEVPPPPFSLFFWFKNGGEGGYHALIGIVRFRLRMGGGEVSIPFVFLTKIVCMIGFW